jgi:hypothetical protein
MPELLSSNQATQIGAESTPGTGVAASKSLQAFSIVPSVAGEYFKFRPIGYKVATTGGPLKEYSKAKLSGQPTYDELIYPLCGIVSYAAPVQQGATTAYKWTLPLASAAADAYKAYTVENGSSTRARKAAGMHVNGFKMNFSRGGIAADGDLIGAALQDGISMTGSPSALPVVPVLPQQVDLYVADTYAGLAGASALSRGFEAEFAIANRWATPWPLGSTLTSPIWGVEQPEPGLTAKLIHVADATGMGLLTQMRAGSSKFFRIKCVGSLIATSYYYTLQIDMCCKVVGEPDELSDRDGLFSIGWNFDIFHDSTWGKGLEVQLTNTQTAI